MNIMSKYLNNLGIFFTLNKENTQKDYAPQQYIHTILNMCIEKTDRFDTANVNKANSLLTVNIAE